jgi:hypothetical protein
VNLKLYTPLASAQSADAAKFQFPLPALLIERAIKSPMLTAASAVRVVVNHTLSSLLLMTCEPFVLVPHKVPDGVPVAKSTVSSLTSTVAPVVTVLVAKPIFLTFPAFGIRNTEPALSLEVFRRMELNDGPTVK